MCLERSITCVRKAGSVTFVRVLSGRTRLNVTRALLRRTRFATFSASSWPPVRSHPRSALSAPQSALSPSPHHDPPLPPQRAAQPSARHRPAAGLARHSLGPAPAAASWRSNGRSFHVSATPGAARRGAARRGRARRRPGFRRRGRPGRRGGGKPCRPGSPGPWARR
jgi:hypothetical protein